MATKRKKDAEPTDFHFRELRMSSQGHLYFPKDVRKEFGIASPGYMLIIRHRGLFILLRPEDLQRIVAERLGDL